VSRARFIAPLLALVLAPAPVLADDAIEMPADDSTARADTVEPVAPAAKPAPRRKKFYIRAGVARIAPLESANEMELADVDGAASLAVENGPIAGSGAEISSVTIPAVIIGYRTPWLGGRLALETVLGAPFTVKFTATGTLANESLAPMALGIPTGVQPLGPEIGEAKAAPPTLTAIYELLDGPVVPYAGAGLAVMVTYDAKVTNPILTEVAPPDFSVAPAPGLVLQGGLDATIYKRIYARLDVKFIALMRATAEVKHIQVRTPDLPLFDTAEVGTARMTMWVNPLIIQAGIGTDF